jgi:uroporphyrin-III C-methyltransferase
MRLPAGMPAFEPGWVWLAGAGPGDPGLLTLHTLNALAQADVVVHDALVGPEILGLARTGAVLEYAGKRGHKPSIKQAEITSRLVQLARRGKRVLRLKGGDPLMFGRGGEEALALVRAGVPFRILPGVSSGVGGLAYAGIPVTHRTVNSAVTFVTGHDAKGRLPADLDWDALSRGAPVLVVFMGLRHLGAIADRLVAAGRSGAEPVAIVSDASLPTQRVIETTLATAADDVAAAGLAAPALIVVGEVVRAGLDWIGALAGRALDADADAAPAHHSVLAARPGQSRS